MGTYVYRVTAKRVTCSDGKQANVIKYAYKPTYSGWDADKTNARWHFKSGATASDAMAARGNITDRIVHGDDEGRVYEDSKVFENPNKLGSFADYGFGTEFPVVQGVTVIGALPAKEWETVPLVKTDCRNCGGDGYTHDAPVCPACKGTSKEVA